MNFIPIDKSRLSKLHFVDKVPPKIKASNSWDHSHPANPTTRHPRKGQAYLPNALPTHHLMPKWMELMLHPHSAAAHDGGQWLVSWMNNYTTTFWRILSIMKFSLWYVWCPLFCPKAFKAESIGWHDENHILISIDFQMILVQSLSCDDLFQVNTWWFRILRILIQVTSPKCHWIRQT